MRVKKKKIRQRFKVFSTFFFSSFSFSKATKRKHAEKKKEGEKKWSLYEKNGKFLRSKKGRGAKKSTEYKNRGMVKNDKTFFIGDSVALTNNPRGINQ